MRIKKYILSLILPVVISACSTLELPESKSDFITLDVLSTQSTKAISDVITSTMQSGSGFRALAMSTAYGTVLFNENARYDSNNGYFKTADDYYFSGLNYNFFAVYPPRNISISQMGASGQKTVFLSGIQIGGTEDIVVAVKDNQSPINTSVGLTFEHILSGISFVVRLVGFPTGAECWIKNFKITYLQKNCNYVYGSSSSSGTWTIENNSYSTYERAEYFIASDGMVLYDMHSIIPGDIFLDLEFEVHSPDHQVLANCVVDHHMLDANNPGCKKTFNLYLNYNPSNVITTSASVEAWSSNTTYIPF